MQNDPAGHKRTLEVGADYKRVKRATTEAQKNAENIALYEDPAKAIPFATPPH